MARTGARMLVLPGASSAPKADALAERLRTYARYRRRRRQGEEAAAVEARLYEGYRSARTAMKVAIKAAKSAAWEELLGTLDRDPWGRPYHLVRQKLRPWAPPLTQSLPPHVVTDVVGALFPSRAEHPPPAMAPPSAEPNAGHDDEPVPAVTREELGAAVLRMKSKNTAPGLDGIPGRAWVLSHDALESRLTRLFTACLIQGQFPTRWKTGKLVLIRKEGRPRAVVFPGHTGWSRRAMSCGVPQGSVLGPLLWNIAYDWTIRGAVLSRVSVTCYADDTLVAARGRTHEEAGRLATAGVAHVVARIQLLGLKVALHKTEAVVFHGPRNKPPSDLHIDVGGTRIAVGARMKYLGLVLDSRWEFSAHFEALAPKLLGAAGALLLPNVGGPGTVCRKLYTGVLRSMALYGAPVWVDSLHRKNRTHLRRSQRVLAVRAIRGYRTVSWTAATLLASDPPWELQAETLAAVHRYRQDTRDRGERPQGSNNTENPVVVRRVIPEISGFQIFQDGGGPWPKGRKKPSIAKSFLSREYTGHQNIMCGILSTSSLLQMHEGFSLHPKRFRYSENPPCPVKSWVCKSVRPTCLIIFLARVTSGKKSFVTDAVDSRQYLRFHSSTVPIRNCRLTKETGHLS
ncbi:hypothetical protein K1T71_012783 [Dendrolimus kikuchii]|uniref:Uncharacterized protein n=1 Tax=Dendrolimus kikuchii TaxID=765133 RepID=A0ACC1CI16_9NEOP|nr:hypothetical protein K1T71_012783 [Dendrolimus kikuchii]